MQPQHFVQFIFLIPIIICTELYEICRTLPDKTKSKCEIVAIIFWVVLFAGNVRDHVVFQSKLWEGKGIGAYSIEYNYLAQNAIENREEGILENYIFAEPGFYPAFIYLTENQIPTDILYDSEGYDKIEQYLSLSNSHRVLFVVSNDKNKLMKYLNTVSTDKLKINISDKEDNFGHYIFSVITVTHK